MSLEAWGDENPDYADGYLNEDQVAVVIDEATKELQQEVERLREAAYEAAMALEPLWIAEQTHPVLSPEMGRQVELAIGLIRTALGITKEAR